MNAPLNALNEMQRLTSPFPESVAVKEWKASGGKVIGWFNPYILGGDHPCGRNVAV
jgi:hypothetical protein